MKNRSLTLVLGAALGLSTLWADPCGMVPPVVLNPQHPELVRVGDQLTFVFFKDGLQDIVLRPGFKGKLTDFGMLIPFPVPPEIRKVPDPIFTHLEKTVDPPEVVINLKMALRQNSDFAAEALEADDGLYLLDQVKVLREEAVGMYQVAVLEAKNPEALQFWMTRHGYVYPGGMDKVCGEYIKDGWCWVAVKANIGSQTSVEPRPGMRKADSETDNDGFEGAVQAMGFRFKIKEPVVPMRLSAFNAGPLKNRVYFLAEKSCRIKQLPKAFVKGQVDGATLLRNLQEPLALRIIGGTEKQAREMGLLNAPENNRDPHPHNGHALDLFATDLLAAKSGVLTHPFEAREKELLKIGERLGLRGEAVDELNNEVIAAERSSAVQYVIQRLKSMTLTLIEGDFPREVIAAQNLSFEAFDAVAYAP